MITKIVGVVLVLSGSILVGFSLAGQETWRLHFYEQLGAALELMQCEIRCIRTPLPQLCAKVARASEGVLGRIFDRLGWYLGSGQAMNAAEAMEKAMGDVGSLPGECKLLMLELSSALGQYDVDSQINFLETVRQKCMHLHAALAETAPGKIKSFRTLGVCAGLAMAIVLL